MASSKKLSPAGMARALSSTEDLRKLAVNVCYEFNNIPLYPITEAELQNALGADLVTGIDPQRQTWPHRNHIIRGIYALVDAISEVNWEAAPQRITKSTHELMFDDLPARLKSWKKFAKSEKVEMDYTPFSKKLKKQTESVKKLPPRVKTANEKVTTIGYTLTPVIEAQVAELQTHLTVLEDTQKFQLSAEDAYSVEQIVSAHLPLALTLFSKAVGTPNEAIATKMTLEQISMLSGQVQGVIQSHSDDVLTQMEMQHRFLKSKTSPEKGFSI